MSHNKSKKEGARYTVADETALLVFLLNAQKASAGNGMNLKSPDWKAAAAMLNNNTTDGRLRTYESCRAKYRQLKAIYDIVKAVRSNSGWKWDDEKGADITPASKGVWDDYVAAHPKAASFRNRGWVHLAIFDVLGGAPPNGLQGPSVAGSSQPADTQGPEERGDSSSFGLIKDEPESHTQVGEENVKEPSDDEGKLSTPLAAPAPSRRKRAVSAGPTTSKAQSKRPRVSASTQALGDLTATFNHVAAVLEKAFKTNVPTSPTRTTDSMKLAIEREKDWLTKRQMALLLGVFEKEPFAAESYQLVQEDDELRREWICVKLNISLD